jgi:hypothetical protein
MNPPPERGDSRAGIHNIESDMEIVKIRIGYCI